MGGDCTYLEAESEIEVSNIEGTPVTIGYRSTEKGDLYVAEFEHGGIVYQVVAEQVELEEVVKVVTSIIIGSAGIAINE